MLHTALVVCLYTACSTSCVSTLHTLLLCVLIHCYTSVLQKFQWRVLQNVTYKDKKFWFEISSGPKGSGSQTYQYHTACTREAMNIWQMAKDQHSFFKKRKNQVRC